MSNESLVSGHLSAATGLWQNKQGVKMSNVESFEEIDAWKKARKLVNRIYKISSSGEFSKDWSLKDQVRRAALSIMSNIAEGYSRQTDKEFTQFLFIARGSTAEVQSQLYVALDLEYIDNDKFELLYQETIIIIKLLSGFIKYLKKTNKESTID